MFDQLQTRSEFSSSYVGKSHEPDGTQSSRLSDPLSDGAGLASAAGGVGGADEMDSGKLPPHVSLGKKYTCICIQVSLAWIHGLIL